MIVLVSVIYLINLNIPVAAEENEQDIIFSPNWMLENGYKEEVEENQEILPFATRVNVNWKVGLKTEKKTKTQRIAELEQKLEEANAQHVYLYHFASKALDRFSTDKLMGSGVVLSLTLLGGKELFKPVMIFGGLSRETI